MTRGQIKREKKKAERIATIKNIMFGIGFIAAIVFAMGAADLIM